MTSRLLSSASVLALGLMIGTSGTAKADAMHDAAVWEFYLGAHGGLGMLDGEDSSNVTNEKDRGVFGGLVGVNLRLGYWLFGLEGDIGFSSKSRIKGGICDGTFTCKMSKNYHLRGRLGYSVTPNVDLFVAAGRAFLDMKFSTIKKKLTGLSIGAGTDIKLGQIGGGLNPVLRIEALYDMYGDKNIVGNYSVNDWDDFTVRAAAMFSF